jgi:hypothetical protein
VRGVHLLIMVVVAGCAADADAPTPIVLDRMDEPSALAGDGVADADVCALAAALPADDICSLVCDPAAMAAQLVADGNKTGACYQLRCTLTATQSVLVGVCLPP